VRAALYDASVVEHENLVGVHNCGKAMRNHNRCPVRHQAFQRLLNQSFRRGVHARGRLIKNQNRRVLQERPRNREPLFFAHAQFHAALAHHTFQSVRQAFDKFSRVRRIHRAP